MQVWDSNDSIEAALQRLDALWVLIAFIAITLAVGMLAAIIGDYYYAVLARMTSGGRIIQAWAHILALTQCMVITSAVLHRLYYKRWWWQA